MFSQNSKIGLALVAAVFAVAIFIVKPDITQDTGLIVATLAAGSGWLIRDAIEAERAIVTICQAYAAHIEAHFEEINDALSDGEIDRFVNLAPDIASGKATEAMGSRVEDPFASLPDIRSNLHLLSPQTVRYISKWKTRGADLFLIYDKLGTKEMSRTEPERLVPTMNGSSSIEMNTET